MLRRDGNDHAGIVQDPRDPAAVFGAGEENLGGTASSIKASGRRQHHAAERELVRLNRATVWKPVAWSSRDLRVSCDVLLKCSGATAQLLRPGVPI